MSDEELKEYEESKKVSLEARIKRLEERIDKEIFNLQQVKADYSKKDIIRGSINPEDIKEHVEEIVIDYLKGMAKREVSKQIDFIKAEIYEENKKSNERLEAIREALKTISKAVLDEDIYDDIDL